MNDHLARLVFSSAGWSEDQGSVELVVWGRVKRKDEPNWFLQLDGVKIKDQSNQSCGEPESGYFRKSGEKGTVELTV